jgi:hypothetical protein
MLKKRSSVVPLVLVALATASCGGGSASTGSTGTGANTQRPGRPQLSASQISCLKTHGLTMPGQGPGAPGGGGNGAPEGQPSDQQRLQRRQKMIAAFQKCGIQAPRFGGADGGRPGQPQSGGSSQ